MMLGLVARPAFANKPKGNSDEETALQKRAEAFVTAFNTGDAKALAAFWAPDADYVDEAGEVVKGREAIQQAYEKLFSENKGAKLRIIKSSVRIVNPQLALEDGVTEVVPADGGPPSAERYSVVHVKKDGQWFLESVRESPAVAPSQYDHLKDLEWLIGDWSDEANQGETAKASYSWAENQNFITATLDTTLKDVPVAGGTQWIGWDAAGKQIRSWFFDVNGGFIEGAWTKDGHKWTVTANATTPAGKKISATNIITNVDADHFTWQSTKLTVDGKAMPDVPEIKMKRVKSADVQNNE
jgi:uncharacterized protein (TIGR02246 family)